MNDDPNARPSIGERYSGAVSNGIGHEHIILAAGMQHERLGIVLLRLQSEYDAVRSDLERAGHIAPKLTEQARDLTRRAALAERLKDYDAAAVLKTRAAEMRARTTTEVLSARAFILMGLKTLHAGKQQFGAFALGIAMQNKRGRFINSNAAMKLAGRVLDVWLDPTCHVCDGTGIMGNRFNGDVEHQCSACLGSGHRRDVLGNNPSERRFASDLLAELQRRVAAAAGGIGKVMGEPAAQKEPSGALRDMHQRLGELRTDMAQSD